MTNEILKGMFIKVGFVSLGREIGKKYYVNALWKLKALMRRSSIELCEEGFIALSENGFWRLFSFGQQLGQLRGSSF